MKIKYKFTPLHRILHWIIAIAMPVLFITGFLRMYWMNTHHIVGLIKSKTNGMDEETMMAIAKSIREPMWEWHITFAHIVIFAFLARIIYMLKSGIRFPNPFKKKQPLKERLQGFIYMYFYLFISISAITGIMIKKGILTEWESKIETIHKLGIYWFPLFILLHLSGLIIAEISNKKGIISKMVGGD